jgi:hypothetical protein
LIIGFIGQRNSGKTLSMTIEAYKKYKQGYKIYSNYHLNFPYTSYTKDDLLAFAEAGMYFGNTIFIVDEIHILFDSYNRGKASMIFSYFLNQSSKNDIDIYYTTQYARQVFIRLRINTEVVVECNCRNIVWKTRTSKPVMIENYRPKPNDYRCDAYIYNKFIKFSDTAHDKVTSRVFSGKKYFPLYNTREVVKMQKDVFQRAREGDKRNIEFNVQPVEKVSYKETRRLQHLNRITTNPDKKQMSKQLKKEFPDVKFREVEYFPEVTHGSR